MKTWKLIPVLALACISASAPSAGFTDFDEYGPFLDSLRQAAGVPGMEFAVFHDGGLLYEHGSGLKNQASLEMIDSRTAFEAASISKSLFA